MSNNQLPINKDKGQQMAWRSEAATKIFNTRGYAAQDFDDHEGCGIRDAGTVNIPSST